MRRWLVHLVALTVLCGWLGTAWGQPPEKRGGFGKGDQERSRGGFDQEKGPPGGMRGRMGPGFELGRIIPPPMRQQLELSEEQIQQIDKLEKELKEKLNKLLTEEQKKQLENMRMRGPGGPGGGPGGGPPGGGFEGNRKQQGREGNRPPTDKDRE